MNRIIGLIFSILFFSCSSSKIEKRVLNDFIEEQLRKDKYIKFVIDQPIDCILALDFYEKAYEDRNVSLGNNVRVRPDIDLCQNYPIDILEIKKLKEQLIGTFQYSWKKGDFYKLKFEIVDGKALKTPGNKVYEKYAGSNGLMFSKPVVTSNNKYALLFYGTVVGGGLGGKTYSAVLMEQKEGKWRIVETYSEVNVSYD